MVLLTILLSNGALSCRPPFKMSVVFTRKPTNQSPSNSTASTTDYGTVAAGGVLEKKDAPKIAVSEDAPPLGVPHAEKRFWFQRAKAYDPGAVQRLYVYQSNVVDKRVDNTSEWTAPPTFRDASHINYYGSTIYYLIVLQRSRYPPCYLSN
jgi:hypothetical protein